MMNQWIALVGVSCAVLALGGGRAAAQTAGLQRLKASPDGHSLVKEDGTPFFWMGDTAWWIQRISPEDVDLYLSNRVKNGFNVIQAHLQFGSRPDYAGNLPYLNNNTDTPNEAFFRNYDSIVKKAESQGLYVVLVALWGSEFNGAFGTDTQKAYRLGRWLGARYAPCKNVMWISSGEYDSINGYRLPITVEQRGMIVALAGGLREGSGGRQLMTIHPGVAYTSSLDFHKEAWLDFNMLQSGHEVDREAYGHPENHTSITNDYNRLPVKPVLDGEPFYEDTPDGVWYYKDTKRPRGGADVIRRKAYWAVFAGACGHTYGHNDVYGFYVPAKPGEVVQLPNGPGQRNHWKDSLDAPGAAQMKHVRALMESRAFLNRVPDQTVLASPAGKGNGHVQATRASDGSWAMVYIPTGGAVTVNMDKVSTAVVKCSWFDPRTGKYTPIGDYGNTGTRAFDAPGETRLGTDWVLVLEAAGGKGKTQGR